MNKVHIAIVLLVFMGCYQNQSVSPNWPQPSGPNGNWEIETVDQVPESFSVTTGENILWKTTLPEGGQSGIAVWNDRIFLTVMKPITSIKEKSDLMGADILALCVDAKDGGVLWQRKLSGSVKSEYMYGFSDSSTPGPVTDGEYVWFYNASGNLSCFDFEGNRQWERNWKPIEELDGVRFPFNKQFEPIVHGDVVLNMEPYWEKGGDCVYGWNYIYAIDKHTGTVKWISEDGLTHYNTPQFGEMKDGRYAVLIGRGGHHGVPELPKGYSLIDLENGSQIWQYSTNEGMALYHANWDENRAIWFTESKNEIHVLNSQKGNLEKKISLVNNVDVRLWNSEKKQYDLFENIDMNEKLNPVVFPAWYSNIKVGEKLFFMCFKKGNYRDNIGPDYSFGKVDLETGKVEYLQVPVQVSHEGGTKNYLWNQDLKTQTTNVRGLDVAHDKRSQRDGWHWNFNGNPICVNDKVFFTTMLGVVYCVRTDTEYFDKSALVSVNDLGPFEKTWSVNTPSFANGKLYHRTLKELICIKSADK
ncbi:PQQ-binding-like beta-propeller repeat protein [Echinicola sp. CAU 1574]|uniref:PQQ-binding-like beta-propeller repeat protein n=1 Tax=Echinicola arenosa TaxID=2774144 RepID=A0ABR9AJL4_9BACT|nr:PQQ-binding-like beta-propeller repeat protein [Echinicola arenosa]MBD8487804.1 PQQ-binding-like beta-propeller repeat protein [Echinicola arenosa]